MNYEEIQPRLILGSGRSGTTWVLDSLAEANQLRPIFEPLHEAESELGKQFAYDILVPGDRMEPLEKFFNDLSSGLIRSRWIDFRGRKDFLFPHPSKLMTTKGIKNFFRNWREYLRDRSELLAPARHRNTLIKCIRGNLMAGWFAHDLKFLTILLVRHPCAVVQSQFKIGNIWDPTPVIERYRLNKRLHEVTGDVYLPLLNSNLSRLQALTLNWIIENQRQVRRAPIEGYSVFHYEHLLSNPTNYWPKLCAALRLRQVPDASVLQRPSQQTSAKTMGQNELGTHQARWRKFFTSQQLAEIQGMLDAAECELYSVCNDDPIYIPSTRVFSASSENLPNA